jgi:PAS domain-containing protein
LIRAPCGAQELLRSPDAVQVRGGLDRLSELLITGQRKGGGMTSTILETTVAAGLMLQSLPSPLIAIDAEGRVIEANAAAEEFFSLSRTTLTRMGLADLAPFSSPLFSAVERLRNTGTTLAEYGVKLVRHAAAASVPWTFLPASCRSGPAQWCC